MLFRSELLLRLAFEPDKDDIMDGADTALVTAETPCSLVPDEAVSPLAFGGRPSFFDGGLVVESGSAATARASAAAVASPAEVSVFLRLRVPSMLDRLRFLVVTVSTFMLHRVIR